MKKIVLFVILVVLGASYSWGQSGSWGYAMHFSIFNKEYSEDAEADKTEINIRFYINNSANFGEEVYRKGFGLKERQWIYFNSGKQDMNMTERITRVRVWSKFSKTGSDWGPWATFFNFQSRGEPIVYKVTRICSYLQNDWPTGRPQTSTCDISGDPSWNNGINLFCHLSGHIDFYTFPQDLSIVYQSGLPLQLPTIDKIRISAPSGYAPEVYKWVYSTDNGSTWREIANTALQGSNILEASGKDIYGDNYESTMNIGSNTSIALEYYVYKDQYNTKAIERSNIIHLTNRKSAPHIANTVPAGVKCSGRADGVIKVQLDRPLESGEQLSIYGGPERLDINSLDSDNSFTMTGLPEGTYTVQISGYNNGIQMYSTGINHSKTVTVNSPPLLSYTLRNSTNISCFGGNDGTVSLLASGGVGGYQVYYKESQDAAYREPLDFTSSTETTINNLPAGVYDFYVVDANGCELRNIDGTIKTIQVTLTQPDKALEFARLTPVLPSGYGRSDGSASMEGDGGTPFAGNSYTVTWKNKQTGQTVATVENDPSGVKFRTMAKNIPAGTYTVEIKDANNCTFTDEITIEQPEQLVITIENTKTILCNGDTNGELVAHARGGVLDTGEQYTYQWYKNGSPYPDVSQTDSIAPNLGAGTYKVIVSDRSRLANVAEKEFVLTEPAPLTATFTKQDVTCYGGDNANIQLSISGGAGGYKLYYKLKDDAGYNAPVNITGNTCTLSGLIAGEYQIYVTDKNNCTASFSGQRLPTVAISQPSQALEISSTAVKPVSGFGRSDGSIELKIKGGTPNPSMPYYTVTWKNGSGAAVASTQSPDANGVFTSKTENLREGTYTVEVRDRNYAGTANACYVTATFTIIQPEPLTVELENTNGVYCYAEETGVLTAHAKGGVPGNFSGLPYSYKWYRVTNGTATLLTNQTDSIAANLPAGTYKVRIEDASSPVNSIESPAFEITQPTLLTTILATRNITCYGLNDGFINIEVSGGAGNYKLFCKKEAEAAYREYAVGTDNKTFRIDNLYAGKYSVYIQDANSCYAKINGEDIHEITMTQPDAPLTISAVTEIDASGYGRSDGSIRITVEGGTPNPDGSYHIIWKDEAGQTLPATGAVENGKYVSLLNNIPEGSYAVEVKDSKYAGAYPQANASCTVSELYSISEPDKLLTEVEETHVISCNGMSDGQLVAHATGGIRNPAAERLPYSYTWYKKETDGTYSLLANEKDSILSNIPAGNYKVEIEDYSRVANTISVGYELVQPDLLQASATEISITCGQTATVSATATGGTMPYRYEWSTGDTSQSVANVSPGKYFVYITDSRGCQTTAVARVSTPGGLDVSGTVSHPVCYGASNGSIQLQVTGGTAPYSYKWNTGATAKDPNNLKAGTYTVIVTDSDGCSYTDSFILSDPEPLTVDLGDDRTLCNGQSLTLAPAVTDPGTQFNWTGPGSFRAATPEVTVDKAGTYSLTITDSKGCRATDEINVSIKNADISSEIFVSTEVFTGDTVVIANISNPEPESIKWLIEETDSLQVVEMDEFYARVIFHYPGHYTLGLRTNNGDCFQEIRKTITAMDPDLTPGKEFGESIIDKFYVYPNPNDGNFHAFVGLNRVSAIRLRIINVGTGYVASDKKYNGQKEYDLPYMLTMSPGAYIIVLETASGYMSIKMIVR